MNAPSAARARDTRKTTHRRAVAAVRWLCILGLLLTGVSIAPSDSSALTSSTITIDGNFDDWIAVRADPDNVAFDTQVPDDPDWPGQPDRDIFYVNSTFDDEYLYFCWRRTAGGNKAITFAAYLDLGGDGLLNEGEDVVVAWTMTDPTTTEPSQQNYDEQGRILHYYQARNGDGSLVYPAGDPMDHYGPLPTSMQSPPPANWQDYRHATPHGDGNTPDGWAVGLPSWGESFPAKTMDGYMDPVSGIEAEARVAWSDLGFGPGEIPPLMAIHFASGNGEDFGTVNKTSMWPGDYRQVSGKLYESNAGQVEDNVKGLYWLSTASLTVVPDRSGGGAPGSTVVYRHTITNDGNSADSFNLTTQSSRGWPVSVTDVSGNPVSVLDLARGESADVLVSVSIPANATTGSKDSTRLTASSQSDPSITDSATDTTVVGLVTLAPDRTGSIAPGQTIEYTYTLQNNLSAAGTFDLTTASTLGFPAEILDAAGNPLSTVSLAAGAQTQIRVRVSVPAGTAVGSQDVMTLTAREQSDPSVRASARGTTTVLDGLSAEPDLTAYGGANTWVQYTHTITNSWPTTRTIDLSATSANGWETRIYAADGVTEIAQIDIGPFGAGQQVIVRTKVAADADPDDTDTLTLTGSVGPYSASVTDTTIVRMLATYRDSGYVNADTDFFLTDTMYARSTGLKPGDDVYFVWKDSNGQIVRTSNDRTVDTQGMAFDEYLTTLDDPTGAWVVELRDARRDTLLATSPLNLFWKAEITELSANDASSVGDDVTVSSAVQNEIGKPISDSTVEYVIWWDSDGDGSFGSGDIYIDDTGAPVTWDGASAVAKTHVTTGIDVAGSSSVTLPDWSVNNAQFPNQGTYNVTATWIESDGVRIIDEKTTQFYSIPTLGWPLFGLVLIGVVAIMWRKMRPSLAPVRDGGGDTS